MRYTVMTSPAFVRLKALAPYALIELVLPGGSVMALLLWLYRRRKNGVGFGPVDAASGQTKNISRTVLGECGHCTRKSGRSSRPREKVSQCGPGGEGSEVCDQGCVSCRF